MLTEAGRNAAVNGVAAVALYVAAHDGYPEVDGSGSEIPGTRTQVAWLPGVNGIAVAASSPSLTIAMPTTVRWFSLWDGPDEYDTCIAITPSAPSAQRYLVDASADTIAPQDIGEFAEDAPVVFWGTAVPGGLTAGTTYYAVNVGATTFQVAETMGGAPVDLTGGSPLEADAFVAALAEVVFTLAGTLDVQGLSFDGTGL